ncbi:MAG TPA: phage tail sheath C-terminal domain-containing protein [Methanosarcina sp.]|nr:phage tail sheath C-terminal domain-containing protein [Methanosarcina sp.]
MALVSPGTQISINNQSQYVASNVGSVPLVVLATAQDKQYNGAAATGTSKAMAGKLQSFTSQRDLVTALGTPNFQLSASGTPIHGSEINEYGLLTSYSALGLTNRLFAIRADIDLKQLVGTSVRPVGAKANGTEWLNLSSTDDGIFELNATSGTFSSIHSNLLHITSASQVHTVTVSGQPVSTPIQSLGTQGTYALVYVNSDGTTPSVVRLFHKTTAAALPTSGFGQAIGVGPNVWVQVNSFDWQRSVPTVTGNLAPASLVTGALTINGTSVTVAGSPNNTPTQLATSINAAGITGVWASVNAAGQLSIFTTSAANGGAGTLTLIDPLGILVGLGITARTYSGPILFYGNYAQSPTNGWFSTDVAPKPTGSIWWKTTATGAGWKPVLSQYASATDTWVPQSAPMYSLPADAIYGLDPTGGGANIAAGQLFALNGLLDAGSSNSLRFATSNGRTTTVGVGGPAASFAAGQSYVIQATAPGLSGSSTGTGPAPYTTGFNAAQIITTGTTADSFVLDILNANIPYVTASYNSTTNTITIAHTSGGFILLTPGGGGSASVLTNAGIGATGSSSTIVPLPTGNGAISIANFTYITNTIVYSASTPYDNPANNTLWYYSSAADVDIMINDNGWKGYQNVVSDVRGYNLSVTDPAGVIVTATTAPTSQTDGTALVAGDLWLDSSDLVNYPKLYRYNGVKWIAIDTTDAVSSNGIVFADARWGSSGNVNPITGDMPSIAGLLISNYIDQDAPDYRLYPRGTLLFNTRRSGFNVKQYISNYFNETSFPTLPAVPGANGSLPAQTGTWVSTSGLNNLGVMYAGSAAQRNVVVKALQSAINSNTDILNSIYPFNLIVAPGYPELIPAMTTLNDNRGSTGFVIGDSPMTLPATTTALTDWSNNTGTYAGKGLATANAYLGVYYPAGLTTDLAGNSVAVPASHAALRTYLYNDQVSYPWYAPAGVQRGLVTNLTDIGVINAQTGEFTHNSISQGLRDSMATLSINPIAQLPGVGLVIWGQQTRSGDSSARNRVNVVRLENYLRTIFASVSNGYLFEPNDTITRKSIATQIEGALHNVLSLRGLYDFAVVCDTTNNTATTIANSQLYVDVAIAPMRDVEFIYIPIAIHNPGTIK